jgi:hypothetical protein
LAELIWLNHAVSDVPGVPTRLRWSASRYDPVPTARGHQERLS